MPLPKDDDRKEATGQYGTIEFAVKSASRMAEAWYWKENLTLQKWTSFRVLFQRLLDDGAIHNEEQFKCLDGDVYEFKRGGDRLLCYRDGSRYLLTNTLKKSGRKQISKDIKRAKSVGEGHLKWEESQKKETHKSMTKKSTGTVTKKASVNADKLLWNQEASIIDTTELLCQLMKEAGVSRAALAAMMGTTKSNITQILDGSRNMTIRTVSDVMTHLGHEFRASCKDREIKPQPYAVCRVVAEIQIPMREIPAVLSAMPQRIEFIPFLEHSAMPLGHDSAAPLQEVGA